MSISDGLRTGLPQALEFLTEMTMKVWRCSCPQKALPAVLQSCLSYSLTARLAPKWNKAGQYLIAGKDFLNHSDKLNAVVLELSITETQLCVSVEANKVRLPPAVIKDFNFPTPVVENFQDTYDAVLYTTMPNNWCHVLPSMKKGQLISISHRIPQECPFQSYSEFQRHWNSMYGYQLPSESEEKVIYCSLYFKPIGDKLFTYPMCCIRTQPVQCFPRVDLQGVLSTFISDLQTGLESVCGFPIQMSNKPCYYNNDLVRPVSEYSGTLPVNLTTDNRISTVLNHTPLSSLHDTAEHDSSGKPTEEKKHPSLVSSFDQKTWPYLNSKTSSSPTHVNFTQSQSQSVFLRPKLVPVFRSQSQTCHINVTEKQQRGLDGQKKLTAVVSPLSSTCLQSSKLQCSTPPIHSFQFSRPNPDRVTLPFFKGQMAHSGITKVLSNQPFVQTHPQICEISSKRGGDTFESKPKRLKPSVLDVEDYAKSNQLSKVNSVTLQSRGQRVLKG
nr:uncharacterized protein C18orf63 [Misgurnus anguillicaudatus]